MNRELCLEVAAEEAIRLAQERGDVISVFVCGSIVKESPPDYADVDLRVVIKGDGLEAGFFEMKQGVPLEWTFVPKRRFDDRNTLLNASFLALELAKGTIIYDPTGWLGQVREDIHSVCERPSYQIQRSQRLLDAAKLLYDGIQENFESGEQAPLWDVRCTIFWTGETPALMLNEIPNHRRLMVELKDVGVRLNAPELYPTGIETLGAEGVSTSDVETFLIDALDSITYVNTVSDTPHFHISLDKRPYWEHGIRQMLAEGYHREALWPILTLMSAMHPILASADTPESSRHYLRCRRFLDRIGFLSRDDFHQKLIRLGEWIAQVQPLIARQRLSHQDSSIVDG
jgi:hypothetical protein